MNAEDAMLRRLEEIGAMTTDDLAKAVGAFHGEPMAAVTLRQTRWIITEVLKAGLPQGLPSGALGSSLGPLGRHLYVSASSIGDLSKHLLDTHLSSPESVLGRAIDHLAALHRELHRDGKVHEEEGPPPDHPHPQQDVADIPQGALSIIATGARQAVGLDPVRIVRDLLSAGYRIELADEHDRWERVRVIVRSFGRPPSGDGLIVDADVVPDPDGVLWRRRSGS